MIRHSKVFASRRIKYALVFQAGALTPVTKGKGEVVPMHTIRLRGYGGIAPLILNLCTRWSLVVSLLS